MKQVHLLINSDGVTVGAFTNKSLIEEYVACRCEDECEFCESFGTRGNKGRHHDLDSWTVALDDPHFIEPPMDGRENTSMKQVHVLSNGFGEILGAFTDKLSLEKSVAYPPEDMCQYCEFYGSRGEACPYKRSFIDTVPLDDPSLIQHFKARIAQVRTGVREFNKPVEQGLGGASETRRQMWAQEDASQHSPMT